MVLKLDKAAPIHAPTQNIEILEIKAVIIREDKVVCRYAKGYMKNNEFVRVDGDRLVFEGDPAKSLIANATDQKALFEACYQELLKKFPGKLE